MEAVTKISISRFVTELHNDNLAIGNDDHRFIVNKFNVMHFFDIALFNKDEHNLKKQWSQEEHEQRVAFLLIKFIYNKHYKQEEDDHIIIDGEVTEDGSLLAHNIINGHHRILAAYINDSNNELMAKIIKGDEYYE